MPLDLEALRTFVRVAELSSFTKAAAQLGMPKARASAQVKKLEREVGVQLLRRSTRAVHPTAEGEMLLERARGFLADAEQLGEMFHKGPTIRGKVRVELSVPLARDVVIPQLPEFLGRHPQLALDIRASDRVVSAARDGVDIVIRAGPHEELGLVGRRLGEMPTVNLVSPAYLQQYGTPTSLADLDGHLVVHFGADPSPSFEYHDGARYVQHPMRSVVTVDGIDAYLAACVAGLGIVQMPRQLRKQRELSLVEILPDLVARPLSFSLLHTHGRSAPRRVRVVMDWLARVLGPLSEDAKLAR